MGDRANVYCVDRTPDGTPGGFFLYTHWDGYDLAALVQAVLQRRRRWDDPAYLYRMIFSRMVAGEIDRETGYGISLRLCDNEHRIITVDATTPGGRVIFGDGGEVASPSVAAGWSFAEYIELDDETLDKAYNG